MAGRLENKVVVITGAASGFGRATARRFVEEGASLLLADVQEESGRSIAMELGTRARFIRCDVTQEEQVAELIETARSTYSRLDVMFNNAGILGVRGPIGRIPTEEWKATLDTNLNGIFYGCKYAARIMAEQGSGVIINMASTTGILGGQGPHAYSTSKHAVIGLTKSVAAELCRYGIRVNAIAPAGMATPMVAALVVGDPDAIEAAKDFLARSSPLNGRAGLAEDVANAALWLASDESGYTSGHVLVTDAGITTGSAKGLTHYDEYHPDALTR